MADNEKLIRGIGIDLNQLSKDVDSANKKLSEIGKGVKKVKIELDKKALQDLVDSSKAAQWGKALNQSLGIDPVRKYTKARNTLLAEMAQKENAIETQLIREYKSSWTARIAEVKKRTDQEEKIIKESAQKQASYFNTALLARQKTAFGGVDSLGSGDARAGFGQKFMNSIAYGTAYRMQSGFLSAMSEGIEIVKQYEVGVNDLRRTLENVTSKDLKAFGNQAIAFSKDFGIPLQEVQKAMTELARAGIDKNYLKSMTEDVLMGLNTTEVESAADMVGYLVSTVKQLKMNMSESGVIIDSWNKLADKYAVQTDDFAKSLQRAGSASRLLGLDLHEVNAMTVILGEASQASGEMVGQALKSMEVRLLRPETVKTLESYGIAIKKNEQEFLTFEEIMSNVNNRIKDLGEGSIELNTIMDAMGGAWRKNWVQILADDWDRFNQVVSESKDSIGYSLNENAKVMEQFSKKIESMKNAWNELFVRFAENSGLLDQLKFATDSLSSLITWLSQADGAGMKFALRMVEVAAGIKLISVGMKAFNGVGLSDTLKGSFEPLINNMLKFSNTANVGKYAQEALANAVSKGTILAEEAAIVQEYLSQKLGIANVSAKSLNATQQILAQTQNKVRMATLALNVAVTAGIMIITALITALIQYIDYQNKSIERAIERSKKFKEEQKDIEDLKDQYIKLTKSIDTSESSKSKLLEIENKLKDAFKDSSSALDLQNGKIEENIALINQMSRTKLQDYLTMNQVDYDTATRYLETPAGGYAAGNNDNATPEQRLQYYKDELKRYNDLINDPKNVYGNQYTVQRNSLQNKINELETKIKDSEDIIKAFEAATTAMNKLDNPVLDEDTNSDSGSGTSTFSFDSLKKLYGAGKLSDKDYISYLQGIMPLGFGSKSTEELSALLNNETLKGQVEEYLDIIEEIKRVREKKSTSGTGTNSLTDPSSSLLKKDRYAQLEAELNKTDILLEKNAALQELNKNDKNLLNEEIKLLKQKQGQLHIINEERRKERNELQSTLSSQGFQFTGSGDTASISNYVQVVGKLTDDVNKHRNDKDKTYYNTLKQRLDDAQNNAKRFFELQTNEINKASNEWWKLQKSINDIGLELESISNERLQNLADVEKQLVDIVRKSVEEQLDVLDEAHQKEMDDLEERHQARMDSYDEDLSAYEEHINKKLGLLEDQYSEEDFQDELSKKREEASEIQRKINELALDDSLEARTKIAELTEDLAEKEEEITKFKTDRERELRKDNLSDMLDDYRDHIEDLKDAEEDSYNDRKSSLERQYKEDKRLLEEQLTNESLYVEARKLLMLNTIEELTTKFGLFQDKFGEGMSVLGSKIENDFISKLKEAISLISEMGGLDVETGSSVIDQMKANSEAWKDAPTTSNDPNIKTKDQLAQENIDLAPDDWYRDSNGVWHKPDGTRAYKYGGVKIGDGLAYLHNEERVLTAQQTQSFDRLVDILDRLPELRVSIPNFRMPSYDLGGGEVSIDASIYVEGSVDKSFWSQLKQAQDNQIEKIVKHLNVPTVRRGSI